jgi:hypothetical protein
MTKTFGKVAYLPIIAAVSYLCFTVLIFFIGPFNWPVSNSDVLLAFLMVCITAIGFGFSAGVLKRSEGRPTESWRSFFRVGSIFSIALVFPATWVYTGKWPWEVFAFVGNQGLAYREMLATLAADQSGIRNYLALARAIMAPAVYCVVPFAILRWRELRRSDVVLLVGHIIAILIFSFMRGTDRETGELVVFCLVTIMVVVCRSTVENGRFPFSLSRVLTVSTLSICVLSMALFLFLDRKESRMGGSGGICVAEGVVCSVRDPNETPASAKVSFAMEMLTGYLAQGYYGLSLALKEDFTSTFGFGHSAFLINTLTKTYNESIYERSYPYKVSGAGWSDKSQWSTMFTWIASDVGFPLVPLVIVVMGFLWGSAWKSAVLRKSDAGALVFLFLTLSVLYIPANNQITQTLDSYFAFLFWLVYWLSHNKKIESASSFVVLNR